ncbi:GFA family protein [Inquilinus sp. YAF38]|uniref:GFA family protein n=1 Tax=Inquilinus sp. YAF38 TaxID=3233084 RepID=UPI003F8FB933
MEPITGGCLCGRVRYEASARPRVHYCHCTMCRRATGSAFAVLAWIPENSLRWVGEGRPRERRSSPIARRSFCDRCGTPISLSYDGRDEVALHAGTLDRADAFAPGYHYGVESRLPWADCGVVLPAGPTEERWGGA